MLHINLNICQYALLRPAKGSPVHVCYLSDLVQPTVLCGGRIRIGNPDFLVPPTPSRPLNPTSKAPAGAGRA